MTKPKLWDNSVLAALDACEVLGVQRYREHLDEPEPDASKHMGSVLHIGINTFYTSGSVATAVAATRAAWGVFLSPRKPWLTAEYAAQIMAMFPRTLDVTRWGYEVLHTERYIANESAEHCGILDLHVRDAEGVHGVFDVKSTALWLSGAWQEQWRHSEQGAGYLDLAEHAYGEPLRYFGVLAIHIQSAKPRKDGSFEPRVPKPDDFIKIGPHEYSPALRAELRRTRIGKIARAKVVFDGIAEPIKRTRSCMDFNRQCPHLRYCVMDPSDRAEAYAMAVATGALVKREWKPEER